MPWALVIACCIGMFAATASGSTRAPFLIEMAADFAVGLPAIANLFGMTAVFWGIASFLAGKGADRWGRRFFLVAGPAGLAASLVAVSVTEHYWSMVFCVALAAAFCGSFTAVSMAEVSLRTPDPQRGRALGWVMSGQSLTLLIGTPSAALIGASIGWRGVHVTVAGVAVLAAILLLANTGRPSEKTEFSRGPAGTTPPTLPQTLTGPVVRLFGSLVLERIGFGLAAFFYPAFLRTIYDLQIGAVTVPLVGFALGNIAGTILGGQLADRYPFRRKSIAAMLLLSGAFGLIWFLWTPGLITTTVVGVGFSLFNALSRPPMMAALAEGPAEVRGVIMGLNSTVASMGWLAASALGGWFYMSSGFGSFGPLMLFTTVAGALIVVPDLQLKSTPAFTNPPHRT